MNQQEFVCSKLCKAVVILDKGRSLFPIVDESHGKAFLPVNNKAMLYYPLKWLLENNVNEIFVLVDSKEQGKVQKYIRNTFLEPKTDLEKSHLKIKEQKEKIEVIVCEENVSFTEKLLIINKLAASSLLIVPCDLITNYPIFPIIDKHIKTGNDIVVLLNKKDQTNLIVGLDKKENVLLIERNIDPEIILEKTVLQKHKRIHIHTNLETTEVSFFSQTAIDFIRNQEIVSFTCEEAIAALIQKKFEGYLNIPKSSLMETSFMSENMFNSVYSLKYAIDPFSKDTICSAILVKEEELIRANTITSYIEANMKNTKKEGSVIGKNTKIGNNTKIIRCVIMSDVVIEDNVILRNVVVGPKARICEGVNLQRCEVGPCYVVGPKYTAQNESFCV